MKKITALCLVVLTLFTLTSCSLIREKEHAVLEYRTTMQYYDDFKILQLTDIHLGVESDLELQLNVVRSDIQKEKPDLVVVTGDSFMYASRKIVKKLIKTLNEECAKVTASRDNKRICKFAFTFGNHDNQGNYPRYFINKTILKYTANDGDEVKENKFAAFVDFKNDNLFGLTNYYIDLVDGATPEGHENVIYRLHIIDSNSYYFNGKDYDYDVIHEDQLAHVKKIYDTATADKDYIGIAFFHIPLVEFAAAKDQYINSSTPENVGQGEWREPKVLHGYENNGAYQMLKEANICAFFVGHDHENYGEIVYTDKDGDKAVFSYGVKCTNQLYHDTDMIGYKTITLKKDVDFVTIENVNENIKNITTENAYYEK